MTVLHMRLVVEAADYDEAVAFYRGVLGAPEEMFVDSGDAANVTILDMGRATLELSTPEQVDLIDRVEVGARVSPRLRIAFEVSDAESAVRDLTAAGRASLRHRPGPRKRRPGQRRAHGCPADPRLTCGQRSPGTGTGSTGHTTRRTAGGAARRSRWRPTRAPSRCGCCGAPRARPASMSPFRRPSPRPCRRHGGHRNIAECRRGTVVLVPRRGAWWDKDSWTGAPSWVLILRTIGATSRSSLQTLPLDLLTPESTNAPRPTSSSAPPADRPANPDQRPEPVRAAVDYREGLPTSGTAAP